MGLIDLASSNSLWRGVDYYQSKNVKKIKKISDDEYNSIVSGTEEYNVHIDINHPRKSTCTCPFAAGRRVICKHMVATFFTIYPEEAERIIKKTVVVKEESSQESDFDKRFEEEFGTGTDVFTIDEYLERLDEMIKFE